MKDYTKEISLIAQNYPHYDSAVWIMDQLLAIIRKDVEEEEVKSRLLDLNRQREIFDLRNEIERLKEENKWLEEENKRIIVSHSKANTIFLESKKKYKQLIEGLEKQSMGIAPDKSDNERLWEVYRDLLVQYKSTSVYAGIRDELIFDIAQKAVTAWKDATK